MAKVKIEDTGEEFICPPGKDILRGMQALGRKGIPVGCRGGGRGICKVRLLEGKVRTLKMSRAHVTEKDEKSGIFLACRAFPESDIRIKVLGKIMRAFDPTGYAGHKPDKPTNQGGNRRSTPQTEGKT